MKKRQTSSSKKILQIEDCRLQLEEAQETLAAIRRGAVDALVASTPKGERVFTLKGAEHPYRVFVETMNEGAVTLDLAGTILYCNERFASMLGMSSSKVIGSSLEQFIDSTESKKLNTILRAGKRKSGQMELSFLGAGGQRFPVQLSFSPLKGQGYSAVCLVATNLTEIKVAEKALKDSNERLHFLSTRLLMIQEQERKRIALDIHDSLGSSLSAIKFKLENTLSRVGQQPDLDDAIRIVKAVIEDSRKLQVALRPPLLDDLGILATIGWLCREFQNNYQHIRVKTKIDLAESRVPEVVKTAIFRIAQESLNNVAKHSGADMVRVSLYGLDEKVMLTVQDNGRGFDPQAVRELGEVKGGIGLIGMQERAELSGGRLVFKSKQDLGTTVWATWPLG